MDHPEPVDRRVLEPGLAGVRPEPDLRLRRVARHVARFVAARREPGQAAGGVERAAKELGLAGRGRPARSCGERRIAQREEPRRRRSGVAPAAEAPWRPPPTARARSPSAPAPARPFGSRSASNATWWSGPSGTTISRVTPAGSASAAGPSTVAAQAPRERLGRLPALEQGGEPLDRPRQRVRRTAAAARVTPARVTMNRVVGAPSLPATYSSSAVRSSGIAAAISLGRRARRSRWAVVAVPSSRCSASAWVSRSASVRARRRSASVNAASARPPCGERGDDARGRSLRIVLAQRGGGEGVAPELRGHRAPARQRSRSSPASVSSRSARSRSPAARAGLGQPLRGRCSG